MGYDPDRLGVGSGFSPGNPVNARLFVPPNPTLQWYNRYTFILCGTSVPRGATYHLRGFSQKLEIGASVTVNQDGTQKVFERQVVSPDWAFADGNVSWSIRYVPGYRKNPILKPPLLANPANRGPSKSTDPYVVASTLLFQDSVFARYEAPMSANFPGDALMDPGTIYDLRNPYQGLWQYLIDIPVTGPGDLIFCASVWQTDKVNRPVFTPPPGFNPNALAVEDQFLLDFPDAVYRHIGGRMLVEIE